MPRPISRTVSSLSCGEHGVEEPGAPRRWFQGVHMFGYKVVHSRFATISYITERFT